MRYLFVLLASCFCCGMPQTAAAVTDPVPAEVTRFLSGKKVVGSIEFSPNSAQLTYATRANLRNIAEQANKIAKETDIFRVEGWDDGGTILAIERAKTVSQFLQEELQLKHPVYFTGITRQKDARVNSNRADLVIYENILAVDAVEKELMNLFFD